MCIRELDFSDVEPLLAWLQAPEAQGWLEGDGAGLTRADVEGFVLSALLCAGDSHWAIVDEKGCFAGLVSLKNIEPAAGRAEFSIGLLPAARGRGLARRAATAVQAQAFGPLGLSSLYMSTKADNAATVRFNLACGFTPLAAAPPGLPPSPLPVLWFQATPEADQLP